MLEFVIYNWKDLWGTRGLLLCDSNFQVKKDPNLNQNSGFWSHLALYGFILGFFLKVIEFLTAGCVFVIIQLGNKSALGSNCVFIFFIVTIEAFVFIPCYFGGTIYITSNDYITDLFSCEWDEADVKYKKMIYIFMEYLKTPVSLNVWLHPQLNLEKFTEVIIIIGRWCKD